jgi:hypothetical protein
MCKCASVQVCKCANVQMCKCANVQMCKCASVQMCKLICGPQFLSVLLCVSSFSYTEVKEEARRTETQRTQIA